MNAALNIPLNFLDNHNNVVQFSNSSAADINLDIEKEAYDLFYNAVSEIKTVKQHYTTISAVSFGKDSTVLLLAALQAHRELIEEELIPNDTPFIVTTIDTGLEPHMLQFLVKSQIEELRSFGSKFGVVMDIRVAIPELAKSWASLYLSGMKLFSTGRTSSDCSVILKVDNAAVIEKALEAEYGSQTVTLLGSRISESAARARSLKKTNNDTLTADDLIARNSESNDSKVLTPICNMTADHVWMIIRRAGTNPIIKPSDEFEFIPSYTENHRLLDIVYRDATDSSCPVSSKKVKGESNKAGGCGGSSRTGCTLCLKVKTDSSGEAMNSLTRNSEISGNILKCRNYMSFISENIDYRSWQGRAVDSLTGGIALQPNVLSGKTLDTLILLLSQVTADEELRAEEFAIKVKYGNEMDDAGYRDIMTDHFLSDEDKQVLGDAYKKYAIEPLVKPLSFEQCIFISLIHSRDGIRIPPYRALWHWNNMQQFKRDVEEEAYVASGYENFKTRMSKVVKRYEEEGLRIPYPEVNISDSIVSSIPDAVMAMPEYGIDKHFYQPGFNFHDEEYTSGCEVDKVDNFAKVPVKLAKFYLPDDELHKLDGLKSTDTVPVRGLKNGVLLNRFSDRPVKKQIRKQFSKRKISKTKAINGQRIVVERGRTSLDSPSFGARGTIPSLENSLLQHVEIAFPDNGYSFAPCLDVTSEIAGGYAINESSLYDWIQFDNYERALAVHDEWVATSKASNKSIYRYAGMGVIESLMRYGIISLKANAKRNLVNILRRTSYFNSLGLFFFSDSQLAEYTLTGIKPRAVKKALGNHGVVRLNKLMLMKDFRSLKATRLLNVRSTRNIRRKDLKEAYKDFKADKYNFTLHSIEKAFESVQESLSYSLYRSRFSSFLLSAGQTGFDTLNNKVEYYTHNGFVESLRYLFTDIDGLKSLMTQKVRKEFADDITLRKKLISLSVKLQKKWNALSNQTLAEELDILNANGQNCSMLELQINFLDENQIANRKGQLQLEKSDLESDVDYESGTAFSHVVSLNDSPVDASTQISW